MLHWLALALYRASATVTSVRKQYQFSVKIIGLLQLAHFRMAPNMCCFKMVGEKKQKREPATRLYLISIIFFGIAGGGNNVNLDHLIYTLQRGDNFI